MTSLLPLALLTVLSVSYPGDALSQATKKREARQTSDLSRETSKAEGTPKNSDLGTKPFQPIFFASSEAITSYLVNEPAKVYEWIETKIREVAGKPDQYSTSDEHQRYDAALASHLAGVRPIPFIASCLREYKADQQLFEVKVLMMPLKDSTLNSPNPAALNLRKVSIATANKKSDVYASQNGYGATVEVSRSVSDEYSLVFPAGRENEPASAIAYQDSNSSSNLPHAYKFDYLKFSAKLAPAVARENDRKIACLYVFSLSKPYIFRYKERVVPTRDVPFDITSNGYAIYGRLDQAGVVNKGTGELYDQASRAGLK